MNRIKKNQYYYTILLSIFQCYLKFSIKIFINLAAEYGANLEGMAEIIS